MDLLQSIILGLIQGTTEWLPISSTGHLRIAEHFFALSIPLVFDALLHFGTLLVTLIYFRKSIKGVLTSLWHRDLHSADGKLIIPIIVGMIPTALIAGTIGNELDSYFSPLIWLSVWFIITGVILFACRYSVEKTDTISIPAAFIVGVMQGFSVIPSFSKSAFTIATMLLLGVKRELAFKFSFLLSIPAVAGAIGLTLLQEGDALSVSGINFVDIFAALAASVAISFLALKLLEKSLDAKKFWLFSFYCFAIGVVLAALSLIGH